MPKHLVQETLSLEKYQKDLEKIREKRGLQRDQMKKKLDNKKYKFQKDQSIVEKNLKKKKADGSLTEKDILEAFLCLNLFPMVHGASIQIRSGAEGAILGAKRITDGTVDELKARQNLPGSFQMTHGFMALIEPEIEKFQRELKDFYKKLYA